MKKYNRLWPTLLALILVLGVSACGGGTTGTPVTPPPGTDYTGGQVPDVLGNKPGDNGGGGQGTTTITLHKVAPLGDPGNPSIGTYTISVAPADNAPRGTSAILASDRDQLKATINANGNMLWTEAQTAKTITGPWGSGSYISSFHWNMGDPTSIGYNTQSVTADGLLTEAELYQLTNGANVHVSQDIITAFKTSADTSGQLYNAIYTYYGVTHNPDGNVATNAGHVDRGYGYDPIFFVHLANITQDGKYNLWAQQIEWDTVNDCLTAGVPDGGLLADYYVNTAGRKSLGGWDVAQQIEAAALTQNYSFATQMADWLYVNRSDWEDQMIGSPAFDYTNLSWAGLVRPLALLQKLGGPLSANAQLLYNQAVAVSTGQANTPGFTTPVYREGSWGYLGDLINTKLYDNTQVTGYALQGLGYSDMYDTGLHNNQAVLDAADGGLEWFLGKVLSYHPDGTIRSFYRGNLLTGDPDNFETNAETGAGLTVATEQFVRFPDQP